MIHGHPPQPQQQQAHPHMAHPPPPTAHQVPPPHLTHLTSVPPPNVPQPGTMPQQQQQPPPPPQIREHHSGPRINNRHHHHPRVPAGGDHHQSMPGPHMPLQGSRKPPSQHYGTSNGMTHGGGGGGMGSKHQHSGMGHPPKTLPYSSSSSTSNSSSHQHQQHHHQQHNHHSHHHTGHHNSAAIPVVSAAGPGASKARMIPSHEPKIIHNHSNTASVGSNNNNNNNNNANAIVVHQVDPVQQQLSGGISSSTATTTPGTTTNMSSNTASAPSSGSIPAVMGGSGGGGGGGGGGSAGVIPASTATTVVVMGNASDSNQKDSTTIIHSQSILLSSVPETLANTKEKTPMCLVNELARYNKIQHQYRLTGESGPAHKKRFTVTLKLGDEEYTAEGPSIKKAQHSAAHEAIGATKYKHPPAKTNRTKPGGKTSIGNITPTVELNALAMKRGEPTVYETEQVVTAPKYPVNSHPPGAPNTPQQGGAGSHNFFAAPPPGAHYGGYHRSNSTYNAPPPAGVRYGAPPPNSFNRRNTMGGKPDYHSRGYYYNQHVPPMAQPVPEVYKVTLHVGERTFLGEGHTLQAARHDAAARALEVLKPLTPDSANAVTDSHNTSIDSDDPNSELKSPISLVHEMALKRKLSVQFEVHGEKGPPHMKVFTTLCKVGTIVTEGEGNGKKLSKKRAAEKMLDELRKLPPASPEKNTRMLLKQKRKVPLPKKKTRNLIKEKGEEDPSGMVNPISRLMQIQQARKEKEPVYTLLEERGVARRREFIMEVSASGKSATGVGSTKKLAKKEAAENLLVMLGYGRSVDGGGSDGSPNKENMSGSANEMVEKPPGRKIVYSEGGGGPVAGGGKVHHQGGGGSSGRQIVPGVLQLHSGIANKPASGTSAKEPSQESNVSVESSTSASAVTTAVNVSSTSNVSPSTTTSTNPAAATTTTSSNPDVGRMKEQLMYLAQLLKFDVMFSDFPKGNHGEYLTLVTLSTEPPQLCHGSGASLEESHDEAARGALEILSKIGLDNVKPKGSSNSTTTGGGDESKSKPPLTNGLKK
ncbi:double-stranded RNA-binding protein Staufen homolog 2 [Ochlerotatus camptorhynchus]|uniref:double-stranded RNA-binding protein Staufen homolog 2 n=1 Tax=Ochlerotatus camptorhynchus TaxID=644619 RepID=UPI0031E0D1EE